MQKLRSLFWALFGCMLLVVAFEIGTFILLRKYNYCFRSVPVKNFDDLEYRYPTQTPPEFEQFAASLPIEIMQNVMSFINKKHNRRWKSEHIKDLYEHAKSGGGLTCNGISELFMHALRLQGYKARKLFLVKNVGNPSASHTVVEIYQEGKWVLYDPTFGACFERNKKLLGATDIAQSLVDGSFKTIEPIFYGTPAHTKAFEQYPVYWLAHFNNVLLFEYGDYSKSWFVRNVLQLPLRYWQGPILYYFAPWSANRYLELLNWFYFFFACVGPLLFILLGSALLFCLFLFYKK